MWRNASAGSDARARRNTVGASLHELPSHPSAGCQIQGDSEVRRWWLDEEPTALPQSRVVVAGCPSSWHKPLEREIGRVMDAELCACEDSDELIQRVAALSARGGVVVFALLDASTHRATLEFFHAMHPNVPIVAIGNGDRFEERIGAALAGVSAFLSSPVSIHQIVSVALRVWAGAEEVSSLAPSSHRGLAEDVGPRPLKSL